MFYGYGFRHDDRTPRERDLEAELDEHRRRDEEASRLREMEIREQQRERQARNEERLRTASDWKEALGKQAYLFEREANYAPELPDDFFAPGAKACRRALEIWSDVEKTRAAEIAELEQRLDAIQDEIKASVAAKLESENQAQGWQNVAWSLRTESDPEDWLDW